MLGPGDSPPLMFFVQTGIGGIGLMAAYDIFSSDFFLTGVCCGVLAAEFFLLALYVVCSPQNRLLRLTIGWAVALALFSAWARGAYLEQKDNLIPEAWDKIPPLILAAAISTAIILSFMMGTLWLLAWRMDLRLQRQVSPERPTYHWSLRDLFALTTVVALTVAIGTALSPITVPIEWMHLLRQLLVRGASALAVALLGLWIVLHVFGHSRLPRTANWPQRFFLLMIVQLPVLLIAPLLPSGFVSGLIWALLCTFNSFILTIVGAIALVHYAGWQFVWRRYSIPQPADETVPQRSLS